MTQGVAEQLVGQWLAANRRLTEIHPALVIPRAMKKV